MNVAAAMPDSGRCKLPLLLLMLLLVRGSCCWCCLPACCRPQHTTCRAPFLLRAVHMGVCRCQAGRQPLLADVQPAPRLLLVMLGRCAMTDRC